MMILYNFAFPANIDGRYRRAKWIGKLVGLAGEAGIGTGENLSYRLQNGFEAKGGEKDERKKWAHV
jgi:hypothetical protein